MKRRRCLRGTASIEALMVILVFVLLWIGVSYVGRLHHAKIASKAEARTCAWRIAESACRRIPPECNGVAGETSSSKGSDALEEITKGDSLGGKIADAFEEVLTNQIEGLFADRVEASSSEGVKRPPIVGKGVVEVRGAISLPCNTKELSVEDVAKDVWDQLTAD